MIDSNGSKDCGNSPKNTLLEKVAVALEVGDTEFLSEYLADGAIWELSDKRVAVGKDIGRVFNESDAEAVFVSIDHVMSHGKVGAVNGFSQNNKGKKVDFCHVIEFSSVKFTKISRLLSYSKL